MESNCKTVCLCVCVYMLMFLSMHVKFDFWVAANYLSKDHNHTVGLPESDRRDFELFFLKK